MIRITVTTDNASMAVNVGGSVLTTHKSFDVHAPELEAFMREAIGVYEHRQFTALELLPIEPSETDYAK